MISVEGVILPNQPLTNIQYIDSVSKLKISHFRDVYCRNELPHKANVIECGIINLDDSRGDGTHWRCWFKRAGRLTSSPLAGQARRSLDALNITSKFTDYNLLMD